MRLGSALLLLGLVALTLLIFGSIETLRVAPRIAKVTEVKGAAVALLPSKMGRQSLRERPLKVGSLVLTGMVIKTGKDSSVTLRWVDEVEMRIGSETELKVTRTSYDKATQALEALLRLNLGTVFVNLKRKLPANSRLELATPAITAAVRGTAFELRVAPDGLTALRVHHGAVAVRAVTGKETEVKGGETLLASPKGAFTVFPRQ